MGEFFILYLDNNNLLVNQVKMRLEWNGYQVESTDNEQEIIYKLQHESIDLLIVDYLTPAPNAFSLLEQLKQQDLMPATIVVSDVKDCRLLIKAMHLGCIDFVVKHSLIQKYFDQLSLSIFQNFDKQQSHKTKTRTQKPKSLPHDFNKTQPLVNTTLWEYFPSQDQVRWMPPQSETQITLTYDEFTAKIHLEDLARVKTQNNICLFSQEPVEYSFRYLSDNKQIITFHTRITAEVDFNGIVNRLYGQFNAVSSEQLTDQNLKLKLSFLENTADAVFITDAKKRIISTNDAFTAISGYSEQEILNKETSILNSQQFDADFFNKVAEQLKNKHFWQGEVLIRHRDGHCVPVWQSTSILKDASGHISQSISVLRDISQQKAYEDSIKFQANFDPLTQLPNRTLFKDRLANAIKLTQRNNNKLALMLLDLDKFKWVNDSLGHHAGDILLQETAKKLQTVVRNSDTVARLGGDEFSVIVPELEKATDSEIIVSKIFETFNDPIIIDQQEVFISGSIGISIFPDDAKDSETLQKNADSAMYIAKNNGRNSYYYYTQSLQQETKRRLNLIDDMRSALSNREFSLHYQPIIDMGTQKVACVETLLRWNHPQHGYVPLDDFIPVAEESGLIREIGNWAIAEVADNIQRWSGLGLSHLPVSLNQSVAQYNPAECYLEWLEILKQKHIPPRWITFELSEKIFLDEKNHYVTAIEKLQQVGIKISLDGFGTGYSSLSYLKKFPVDTIKIDRSFIHSMLSDSTDAVLVETMITLANKLGIKVVATGVENQKQLALLNQQCRYVQGYYFSKPLPLKEFEAFMSKQV